MGRGEESNVVYVGGLKFSTDSDALREYFSSYGKVLGARVRRASRRVRLARAAIGWIGPLLHRVSSVATAPPRLHPPIDRSIDRRRKSS